MFLKNVKECVVVMNDMRDGFSRMSRSSRTVYVCL